MREDTLHHGANLVPTLSSFAYRREMRLFVSRVELSATLRRLCYKYSVVSCSIAFKQIFKAQ